MIPIISVIIPVYNGEAFVENCINSILEQTFYDMQIIVVNDGSTDNTHSILRRLEKMDSRIEVVCQDNGGVSKARNKGLDLVKGEWILFIDSDDVVRPDYCETMLNAAISSRADVLLSKDNEDDKTIVSIINEKKELQLACLSYDEISFDFNVDAPWGKLFRSSIILEKQIRFPANLSRSEDALFCVAVYEYAENIAVINRSGYIHNEREGSLCRSYTPTDMDMLERILMENQKWVLTYHPCEEAYFKALWYRVLPGIVECEKSFFLHSNNPNSKLQNMLIYQRFLGQKMVHKAIRKLKLKDMVNKQYLIRLCLYKVYCGCFFIFIKAR